MRITTRVVRPPPWRDRPTGSLRRCCSRWRPRRAPRRTCRVGTGEVDHQLDVVFQQERSQSCRDGSRRDQKHRAAGAIRDERPHSYECGAAVIYGHFTRVGRSPKNGTRPSIIAGVASSLVRKGRINPIISDSDLHCLPRLQGHLRPSITHHWTRTSAACASPVLDMFSTGVKEVQQSGTGSSFCDQG